jgi:hypothetical protein
MTLLSPLLSCVDSIAAANMPDDDEDTGDDDSCGYDAQTEVKLLVRWMRAMRGGPARYEQ